MNSRISHQTGTSCLAEMPAPLDPFDTPLLNVTRLTKQFSDRTVLDGIDFSVRAGELVAFLGAYGSGKSTTLRCVMGLTDPDGGSIELSGADLSGLRGQHLLRARRRP